MQSRWFRKNSNTMLWLWFGLYVLFFSSTEERFLSWLLFATSFYHPVGIALEHHSIAKKRTVAASSVWSTDSDLSTFFAPELPQYEESIQWLFDQLLWSVGVHTSKKHRWNPRRWRPSKGASGSNGACRWSGCWSDGRRCRRWLPAAHIGTAPSPKGSHWCLNRIKGCPYWRKYSTNKYPHTQKQWPHSQKQCTYGKQQWANRRTACRPTAQHPWHFLLSFFIFSIANKFT